MIAGMKPAPMPWIGCGPGWPPESTGDKVGSTANTCRPGHSRLQHFGAGGDVAAGADAGDQHVDRAVAEIRQYLPRGGAAVDFEVGGIFELLRHPAVLRLGDQFLGAGDRALHPLLLGGEIEGRAIGQHQPAALEAHALGHDQDEPVALDRGDHGEADAGIARGRLDDDAAGLELAGLLRVLDHRERDAVLDRGAGIDPLLLDPDLGVAEQAVDADVRRVADRLEDAGGFHGYASLGWGSEWGCRSCARAEFGETISPRGR